MTGFDRDLADLSPERRWREWMARVEAVLFASASPVGRGELAPLVGAEISVDLLIEDIRAELGDRPYDIVRAGDGWLFRTRPPYAEAIRAAADLGEVHLPFSDSEMAVLCAIAYHQPITRDGLKSLFGREISRDVISRLHTRGVIGTGPRSPRRGAPYTYVTTEQFLVMFDMETLQDLPDLEQLEDAGLAGKPLEDIGFMPGSE